MQITGSKKFPPYVSIAPAITEIHFVPLLKKGTYKTPEQKYSWVKFKYLELSMLS